ncbi:glycerol-3-phosphate dehydrogenase/oxidase [Lentibacillus sediminis]|uniref:glycerol-3-phosphate dehydrogenase/oxidase n=1 Tax=Lentibacillus sediminis TaxID=1940529 RepID=UPI000C1BF6BD|nr:glycerol-3-phosphate dehydrogenase/oxidase [Lentibacillus sediminis]
MAMFSSHKRKERFKQAEAKELDVLVIGGGITGAGIALDAASRGMSTALFEMQDFAAGTSSRSTKLVHGGLRYLKQFEVKMVAEVGKERSIVYENGPHVTTPEWMMLPFHKGGTFGPLTTSLGLRVYDLLAGVKRAEWRTMLKPDEALEKEPLIKEKDLRGAGLYVEYKTDDARLTMEVLKKAVQKGANAMNYAKIVDLVYQGPGQLSGVVVRDEITGETYTVHAKKIVNAAGPWVDELREMDGSKQGKELVHSKGVHLVIPKEIFPLQQAIYFDAPDGRMIFAIPRGNKAYVGTTDTVYEDNLQHPTMTEADRDYLLEAIRYMFPSLNIEAQHVESSWAGLRPLIAEKGKDNPGEISRKDEIFISDSGLISIAGGKLTGYRKMAEDAVDKVADLLKEEDGILYSASETKHMPISGGEVGGSKGFESFRERKIEEAVAIGVEEAVSLSLVQTYGANVDRIFDLYQNKQDQAIEADIDPIVFAQLLYALEDELAYKPVDFFVRRTGALFFDINWVRAHKDAVIRYMAGTLGWTAEQEEDYTEELDQLLYEAVHPVG